MATAPGPAVARSATGQLLAQGPPGADGQPGGVGPAGPQGAQGPPGSGNKWQNAATIGKGLNSNIATGGQPTVRLAGPSGAFSVGGFQLPGAATPQAGQGLAGTYTGGQALTGVDEGLSAAAVARISPPTGLPYTFPPGPRSFTLVFDGALARLVLQNVGVVTPTVL